VVTAFGYFGPYSVANRVTASRACERVSACMTSWSAAFTRGWRRFGSLSSMLPSCGTSRAARASSATCRAPPLRSRGPRRPRRYRAGAYSDASGPGARSPEGCTYADYPSLTRGRRPRRCRRASGGLRRMAAKRTGRGADPTAEGAGDGRVVRVAEIGRDIEDLRVATPEELRRCDEAL